MIAANDSVALDSEGATRVMAPRQVCQLCGHDDDITVSELSGDAAWVCICHSTSGHLEPYRWEVAHLKPGSEHDGICAELGLYDDLPPCIPAGLGWVEHGIIERLYSQARPDQYRRLLELYGHAALHRNGP